MPSKSIIAKMSFEFALSIIELYKQMVELKEFVLSKQLLKSATSVGANVEEAAAAQSRRDFVSKMSIARKEARETQYWLQLISVSGIVKVDCTSHIDKANQIISVLTKIIKTTLENDQSKSKASSSGNSSPVTSNS